jgi:hypothetical protein
MATLRLAARDLDPRSVSEVLDQLPKLSARCGERLYPASQRSRAVARIGTWLVTTEDKIGVSAIDQLTHVVSLVAPHADRLRDMMPDLQINFSLLVFDPAAAAIPDDLRCRAERLGHLDIETMELGRGRAPAS